MLYVMEAAGSSQWGKYLNNSWMDGNVFLYGHSPPKMNPIHLQLIPDFSSRAKSRTNLTVKWLNI